MVCLESVAGCGMACGWKMQDVLSPFSFAYTTTISAPRICAPNPMPIHEHAGLERCMYTSLELRARLTENCVSACSRYKVDALGWACVLDVKTVRVSWSVIERLQNWERGGIRMNMEKERCNTDGYSTKETRRQKKTLTSNPNQHPEKNLGNPPPWALQIPRPHLTAHILSLFLSFPTLSVSPPFLLPVFPSLSLSLFLSFLSFFLSLLFAHPNTLKTQPSLKNLFLLCHQKREAVLLQYTVQYSCSCTRKSQKMPKNAHRTSEYLGKPWETLGNLPPSPPYIHTPDPARLFPRRLISHLTSYTPRLACPRLTWPNHYAPQGAARRVTLAGRTDRLGRAA